MSVSFTWRPTNPDTGISFASGSSLNTAFESAFGQLPITLRREDIGVLRGMESCGYNDLHALIVAIQEHESVEVSSHW